MPYKYNEAKLTEKAASNTDIYPVERKGNKKFIPNSETIANHDQGTNQGNITS